MGRCQSSAVIVRLLAGRSATQPDRRRRAIAVAVAVAGSLVAACANCSAPMMLQGRVNTTERPCRPGAVAADTDLFRKTSGKSLTRSKRRCNTPRTVTLISVD